MTKSKTIPNSKESEMMVLGCMLTSINSLNIAADLLDEAAFYHTEHKTIFQALKKAYKMEKPVDVHLICEELKRQDKLKDVGGAAYITTLAQYAGTSAYIEEYVEIVKKKSVLRDTIDAGQEILKEALEDPENVDSLIENFSNKVKSLETRINKNLPIINIAERLKREEEFLKKHRGEKYLGLRVKTIEGFNENFLGLRGLILLAAAPNVGKTALMVQTAIEVLATEEDACLVFISLEMSEEQIFRRMLLNLSELNFGTFVFGSQKEEIDREERAAFFTFEELKRIESAENILKGFGDRLQIIDQSTCPYINARIVFNYVENLKQKTGTSRAIVIIDYLQVWPVNINSRFPSENEADKWRIGEMKKIRDALNEDPVIVISEARKPSGKDDLWGGDLSDVMGSARGTYTPDVVILFSQPKAISQLWKDHNMPKVSEKEEESDGEIISLLASHGMSICKLKVPKCRDGMTRFETYLIFHFKRNKFEKINWQSIMGLATEYNKKKCAKHR